MCHPRTAQSLGCGCAGTDTPEPSRPNLSAPTLAAASLELKAEKQSAHSDRVYSVAFSPDGKTIVSGSWDQTIKVWDAGEWRETTFLGASPRDLTLLSSHPQALWSS